jgi:hypothetical protein
VLGADRILDRHPLRRQPLVEPGAKRGGLRPIIAHPLEDVDDKR